MRDWRRRVGGDMGTLQRRTIVAIQLLLSLECPHARVELLVSADVQLK